MSKAPILTAILPQVRPALQEFDDATWAESRTRSRGGRAVRHMHASIPGGARLKITWENINDGDVLALLNVWSTVRGSYGQIGIPDEVLSGMTVGLRDRVRLPYAGATWRFAAPPRVERIDRYRSTVVIELISTPGAQLALPPPVNVTPEPPEELVDCLFQAVVEVSGNLGISGINRTGFSVANNGDVFIGYMSNNPGIGGNPGSSLFVPFTGKISADGVVQWLHASPSLATGASATYSRWNITCNSDGSTVWGVSNASSAPNQKDSFLIVKFNGDTGVIEQQAWGNPSVNNDSARWFAPHYVEEFDILYIMQHGSVDGFIYPVFGSNLANAGIFTYGYGMMAPGNTQTSGHLYNINMVYYDETTVLMVGEERVGGNDMQWRFIAFDPGMTVIKGAYRITLPVAEQIGFPSGIYVDQFGAVWVLVSRNGVGGNTGPTTMTLYKFSSLQTGFQCVAHTTWAANVDANAIPAPSATTDPSGINLWDENHLCLQTIDSIYKVDLLTLEIVEANIPIPGYGLGGGQARCESATNSINPNRKEAVWVSGLDTQYAVVRTTFESGPRGAGATIEGINGAGGARVSIYDPDLLPVKVANTQPATNTDPLVSLTQYDCANPTSGCSLSTDRTAYSSVDAVASTDWDTELTPCEYRDPVDPLGCEIQSMWGKSGIYTALENNTVADGEIELLASGEMFQVVSVRAGNSSSDNQVFVIKYDAAGEPVAQIRLDPIMAARAEWRASMASNAAGTRIWVTAQFIFSDDHVKIVELDPATSSVVRQVKSHTLDDNTLISVPTRLFYAEPSETIYLIQGTYYERTDTRHILAHDASDLSLLRAAQFSVNALIGAVVPVDANKVIVVAYTSGTYWLLECTPDLQTIINNYKFSCPELQIGTTATATPVGMRLVDATLDSSGNLHLLFGKSTNPATLGGLYVKHLPSIDLLEASEIWSFTFPGNTDSIVVPAGSMDVDSDGMVVFSLCHENNTNLVFVCSLDPSTGEFNYVTKMDVPLTWRSGGAGKGGGVKADLKRFTWLKRRASAGTPIYVAYRAPLEVGAWPIGHSFIDSIETDYPYSNPSDFPAVTSPALPVKSAGTEVFNNFTAVTNAVDTTVTAVDALALNPVDTPGNWFYPITDCPL